MSRKIIIPIFIPHLGCPHTCVFCNQKKIAGNFNKPTPQKVTDTVLAYRKTIKGKSDNTIELAFYGGSFTAIEEEFQKQLLQTALKLKESKLIDEIRISTRPDYISPEVINRLVTYQVNTVELGVQSLDPQVLAISERGHSPSSVEKAVIALKEAKRKVGIQLMPGLPLDTREKTLVTAQKVIRLKPDFVRIYPTVVIKQTKLAEMYQKGEFQPWSLEEAIEVGALLYILFSQARIPIIRLGLQATENLCEGKDLVAGPYHPAYGELVKSRVFRKQLKYLIGAIKDSSIKNLKIYTNPREISQVKGQHKSNVKYIQDKYGIALEISPLANLPPGHLTFFNPSTNSWVVLSRREFLDKYRINH